MPQSPLATSEILTQVTPRMASPSIDTMASVSLLIIWRFCSALNTFWITWTSINGMSFSLMLANDGSINMPVAAGKDFQAAVIYRPDPLDNIAAKLFQARAAKSFDVMRLVGVVLERQFVGQPGERDVGLGAAEALERGFGSISAAGHAESSRQHAVSTDEIGALPQRLTRQADRLRVILADILAIGGDAAIDRGKGIAGREFQRVARGAIAFLPAPAIGQRNAVKAARGRKTGIKPQRQLEFGDAIVEAPVKQIDAGERIVRPRVLAVGPDRRQRRALRHRNGFGHVLPAHMGAEHMAGS